VRFWDASAVLPLLVAEATTETLEGIHRGDPVMLVWWATELECTSALSRLERQAALTGPDVAGVLGRLEELKAGWHEVQPVESVRRTARRLLRTHALRAADSLQLAAALVASEGDPASMEMVSLDGALVEAAQREGLVLVETSAGRQR